MGLGLAQYVAFRRNLGSHGRNVPDPLPRSGIAPVLDLVVIAVVVISVAVPRPHHTAQVRLWGHRYGYRVSVVPADVGQYRYGRPRTSGGGHHGGVRDIRTPDLADRAIGHHKACAGSLPRR